MQKQQLPTIFLSAVALILASNTFSPQLVLAGASPESTEVKIDAVCYVKLANGVVQDLTKFCGFIKPQSCSGSLGSVSRDRVLTEFCKQNEKCLLTNTCNAQPTAPYGPRPGEAAG